MKRFNKNVNHSYFDAIDTERKAYFLGLIYADGSIVQSYSKDKKQRQKQLCIALQEEDKYLLEELCKDIKPKKTINVAYPPNIKTRNWKKRAVFKVSSDQICEALINMGCIQKKSQLGMKYPALPNHLQQHFIRGFFDGDGCIYVREVKNRYKRTKTYKISNPFKRKLQKRAQFISTSKDFLENCFLEMNKALNLKGKVHWRAVTKKQTAYKMTIEHQEDVASVKHFFYSEATIYMIRKKQKFDMTISSQATQGCVEGSTTNSIPLEQ